VKTVGLFGGAFDPFHLGHLAIVEALVKSALLDELLLVPTAIAPHKNEAQGESGPRQSMLETVLDQRFRGPGLSCHVEVSDVELQREGPSWTIDTVKGLISDRPNDKFYMIVGSDSYFSLHTWKSISLLLEKVDVIVINREQILSETYHIYLEQTLSFAKPDGFTFLTIDPVDASSSKIRRLIASHKSISSLVPDEVMTYIKQHGLYGYQDI